MEAIQFINTTPEALKNEIVESIVKELSGIFQYREDPDKLMTRDEAAKFLKITPSTLHRWTKNKRLKSYGIEGKVYYKKSEILSSLVLLRY